MSQSAIKLQRKTFINVLLDTALIQDIPTDTEVNEEVYNFLEKHYLPTIQSSVWFTVDSLIKLVSDFKETSVNVEILAQAEIILMGQLVYYAARPKEDPNLAKLIQNGYAQLKILLDRYPDQLYFI